MIAAALIALAVFAIAYWVPKYRFDEYLVAVIRSQASWPDLVHAIVTSDPAPGPWYVLMKPWAMVSADPLWTRIPSLVAMAVAVAGLVAFVRRAIDTRTALFAGLVAIALPGMSRWAQDNRMYAAATTFLVLALLCWWISVTGGSRRWSVLYGGAVVAMGLMHLYSLAWIPVFVLAALWVPGDRRAVLIRTIAPAAVAVIVLAPHLVLNVAHPTGSPTNPGLSIHTLRAMILDNIGTYLGVVVTAIGAIGFVTAWRTPCRRAVAVVGVAWVLLPLALFIVARVAIRLPTLVDRYYLFALPGVCVLVALGLDALFRRSRVAAIAALVLIAVLAVPAQAAVRSASSHGLSIYRLGEALRQPELAGLPVVTATRHMAEIRATTLYPDPVPSSVSSPQPVAIYLYRPKQGRLGGEKPLSPYVAPGTAWRPVVQCPFGVVATMEIVALPDATVPGGSPEALARQLREQIPGSRCTTSVAP